MLSASINSVAATYRVIPDRIETGTLLAAGAITGGDVRVHGCRPDHLAAALAYLDDAGCTIETGADWICAAATPRLRPLHLTALPYPGVPTDLQAQFMALAALADGKSTISDSVFPQRFSHVAELRRIGAQIKHRGAIAIVEGVEQLSGGDVTASDLRQRRAGTGWPGGGRLHHDPPRPSSPPRLRSTDRKAPISRRQCRIASGNADPSAARFANPARLLWPVRDLFRHEEAQVQLGMAQVKLLPLFRGHGAERRMWMPLRFRFQSLDCAAQFVQPLFG